jgi:hypothetical protein
MLFAAPDVQAGCWSDNGAASTGWDPNEDDPLNRNLNDFGMFFLDSHPNNVSCSDSVIADRLTTKLNNMPQSAFTGWLAGGNVALAFAAAMQLGPNGGVDADLDAALARAGSYYQMIPHADCGFDNGQWTFGDTCQEDRLIGASAYAWIAAYYRKSGRPWVTKYNAAVTEIQEALSNGDSVCRHDSNLGFDVYGRGPCNGDENDPIISLNHKFQTPSYGIGQITSMAVALIGMDAAGQPWSNANLTTAMQDVLADMWTEGKERANATTGEYENECYHLENWVPTNSCSENGWYQAYRFPVWWAFQRYNLPGRSAGGYQFQLSNGTYDIADRTDFFGAGRYAYYHVLTKAYNDVNEPDPYGWPRPWSFTAGSEYYMGPKLGSYFVRATNNGGSTLVANQLSQGASEKFRLKDTNGGELNSGDTVTLRTDSGWYWSATNGGGSTLYANQTTPITWEVFTIVKRNGTGRIHDGDTFSLKTYSNAHYVNGVAGGTLSASATTLTGAATFTFKHVVDY